jgi:hypothetical protein
MVYTDVSVEHEEEFNRWYDEEHIPERLSIPGVLNAARYVAVRGGPKYLACYEIVAPETWHSDAWQYYLNHPTEWSKRMSPSVIGDNYIRNLYRLIYPDDVPEATANAEMAPALLVGRMEVPIELDEVFNAAYDAERLPLYYTIPGYIRGRRWEVLMGEPKYTTVHECTGAEVADSVEWQAVRDTVTPQWNSVVQPQMRFASGSPGVYRRIF